MNKVCRYCADALTRGLNWSAGNADHGENQCVPCSRLNWRLKAWKARARKAEAMVANPPLAFLRWLEGRL